MTTRNEKLRDYVHSVIDSILDKLIADGVLEYSGTIIIDIQHAFHDIDNNVQVEPVRVIRSEQKWTPANQTQTGQ
jgi:hypothetical protein